jgi:polyhydroxyalkanoate synthesis repressor PhaR
MTFVVRKYSNRRLYDTAKSAYITLEEIAERVRGGDEVRVEDVKTGEDLTQATLAQIIVESRGAAQRLPIPLLVQLIRLDDGALAEFFGTYLSQALDLYMQAKHGVQALTAYNPFANLPFAATSALARLFTGGNPFERAAPPPPPPSTPPPSGSGDVDRLRREVEELRQELRRKRR